MKMVISASGFPRRTSSSRSGRVILLGTARVWSLVTMVTFCFPRASWDSGGVPMGCSRALRTSSVSPSAGRYSSVRAVSTPARFSSAIWSSTAPVSYGMEMVCMVILLYIEIQDELCIHYTTNIMPQGRSPVKPKKFVPLPVRHWILPETGSNIVGPNYSGWFGSYVQREGMWYSRILYWSWRREIPRYSAVLAR